MPDLLPQSILCPVLIGRDAQIAALARLLDQARRGQGQIALVSGEAGIGKSRLVTQVKALAAGQRFIIRQGNCTEKQIAKQSSAGLTATERAVARLIAQGKTNKEIAEELVVSHRTVETHVSNILSKLHLVSRAQIAVWVVEKGL